MWYFACSVKAIGPNCRKEFEAEIHMLVGAVIAGLLIVSLFLEMISSSPKRTEESPVEPGTLK
jgi:hypothetical protein